MNSTRITRLIAGLLLTGAAALPLVGQQLAPSLAVGTPSVNDDAATDYIQFNGSSYPSQHLICVTAGCGGSFTAEINSGSTVATASQVPVTVWCADYQLNVTTSSSYITDVSTLANIAVPTDPYVQYGTLPSSGPPPANWNNALTSGLPFIPTGTILSTVDGGSATTAAYRFTLAAALVSQYVNGAGTPDPTNLYGNDGQSGAAATENLAIQQAIWYLTSNSTPGTDPPFTFGAADVTSIDNYAYWLNYVLTNQNDVVSNLNLNAWAVVSGPVVGGVVTPQNEGGYNSYQTFIAQVLPEPGFYAPILIALFGMFALARLRRGKTAR